MTPVLIAFLALLITYFQLETSNEQQKHDIFKRRFEIYDATRTLIYSVQQSIAKKEIPDEKILNKFSPKIKTAKWILNNEINEYLHEFYEKFYGLVDATKKLKLENNTIEDTKEYESRKEECKEWFDTQNKELDEKFTEFLQLKPTAYSKFKKIMFFNLQ